MHFIGSSSSAATQYAIDYLDASSAGFQWFAMADQSCLWKVNNSAYILEGFGFCYIFFIQQKTVQILFGAKKI